MKKLFYTLVLVTTVSFYASADNCPKPPQPQDKSESSTNGNILIFKFINPLYSTTPSTPASPGSTGKKPENSEKSCPRSSPCAGSKKQCAKEN